MFKYSLPYLQKSGNTIKCTHRHTKSISVQLSRPISHKFTSINALKNLFKNLKLWKLLKLFRPQMPECAFPDISTNTTGWKTCKAVQQRWNIPGKEVRNSYRVQWQIEVRSLPNMMTYHQNGYRTCTFKSHRTIFQTLSSRHNWCKHKMQLLLSIVESVEFVHWNLSI